VGRDKKSVKRMGRDYIGVRASEPRARQLDLTKSWGETRTNQESLEGAFKREE